MHINLPTLKLAIQQTSKRLSRRLPIVLVAAFACYCLHSLEAMKNTYDEAQAKPLVVNDKSLEKVQQEVQKTAEGKAAWPEIKVHFRTLHHQPFNTSSELIAALNREVYSAKDDAIIRATSPDEIRFRQCVAALTESKAAPSDSCYEVYRDNTKDKIAGEINSANTIAGKIHNVLKPEILNTMREAQAPTSPIEKFFQPTLNHNDGLYIIYQVFRLTLIVIIAFSLITIVALVLRTFMFGESVTTFKEQATKLITPKDSAVPSLARAAILSVTALGVGTAVVAGVTISDKADRGLQHSNDMVPSNGPAKTRSVRHNGINGSTDSTERSIDPRGGSTDLRETLREVGNNNGNPLPNVNVSPPNVNVYPPSVNVYPRIITPSSLDPNSEAFKQLQSYTVKLTELQKTMTQAIAALSNPSKDIRIENSRKTDDLPKPLKVDVSGLASDDPTQPRITEQLNDLNKSLTQIEELKKSLERPLNPHRRNFVTRMFTDDYYFPSSQSVQKLGELMEKDASNKLIWEALEALSKKGNAPMKEKEFINGIRTEIKAKQSNWKGIEPIFNRWKATILNYTRLP